MNYVDRIIEKFGGVRPMAAALGKPVSTVHSWKVRGSIPDASKPEVLAVAIDLEIPLRPEHFFPIDLDPAPPPSGKGHGHEEQRLQRRDRGPAVRPR